MRVGIADLPEKQAQADEDQNLVDDRQMIPAKGKNSQSPKPEMNTGQRH